MASPREEEEPVEEEKGTKDAQEQARALDSLTDHVEEKQLDAAKTTAAIAALNKAEDAEKQEREQRERELASVKVDMEDVKLIAAEMEIDEKVAERALRESKGNCEAALSVLVNL